MPMKFAFSTVSCPAWDFETVVRRAKEYGYDGVEVRGFLNEPTAPTAANLFLTDLRKVRGLFESAGVEIACLASSVMMAGKRRKDRQAADELKTYVDTARVVGCPLVKVFDTQVPPGQSRGGAAVALGDWLLPLGDYAAERGVTIVVENLLSFRSAKEMWLILDRLQHPAIACCWDVFNAALIGEGPAVSVPTLNSRIAYVHVKDAKLGSLGATYCKLGEGDVQIERFMTRLLGIGYHGYVTVEWEKAWLPNLAEPEEILPDSLAKLRKYVDANEGDAPGKSDAHPPKQAPRKEPAAAVG